jgi:hypothetical protein
MCHPIHIRTIFLYLRSNAMNARKTTALVLAAAGLVLGLTACGAASDEQQARAIDFLESKGYQDIHVIDEGVAPPLGKGIVYFSTRVGTCKEIEVGIRPGQDAVLFSNLSPDQLKAFQSVAPGEENLGATIFKACKAPLG